MHATEIVCEVRYNLDVEKIGEFEDYARTWIRLIERHGGRHLGFFISRPTPIELPMSFPGHGTEEAGDLGIALFSFPSEEAYRDYRAQIATDADGILANERFRRDPPFLNYTRAFLRPIERQR